MTAFLRQGMMTWLIVVVLVVAGVYVLLRQLNKPKYYRIISPPTDYPYGERQYNVEDLGGHGWTLSQTIADVDPRAWGGILIES